MPRMAKIFGIKVTFLKDIRFHTIIVVWEVVFFTFITKILRAIIVHKGLLKISEKVKTFRRISYLRYGHLANRTHRVANSFR